MRLYELTGNLTKLQELLEDSLESDQCLIDTLEAVQGEYEFKIESYAKVIKNLEADVDALKAEADRLTDRRKVLENNIDKLKRAMFDSMKATNTPKVKGQVFTVAIQRNGGKVPVVAAPDADVNVLDKDYKLVTVKANLDAIREGLEAGKTIKGYTLGERGESLRIK